MAVRIALLQMNCSGKREENLARAEKMIREAASKKAQVLLLPEVFHELFFITDLNARYFETAEQIPGPITDAMCKLARELSVVIVAPIYESVDRSVYYNSAAVIDADGKFLGKYRKTHIPQVNGFWEKFYFRPGNLGFPVFDTAVGKVGVYICYDRHFPEGPRMLGLHGAEMIFIPSATSRGLSMHLWDIEQRSHAIANGVFIGTINRVGKEEEFGPNDYYGSSYFCDPRGQYINDVRTGAPKASDTQEQLVICDMNMDLVAEVRNTWQFYRDRRPDMYDDLVKA